jgi:hypothetical protein
LNSQGADFIQVLRMIGRVALSQIFSMRLRFVTATKRHVWLLCAEGASLAASHIVFYIFFFDRSWIV